MKEPLALAWSGFESNDRSIELFFDLLYAKNTKDTLKALEKGDSLSLSFLFATVLLLVNLID